MDFGVLSRAIWKSLSRTETIVSEADKKMQEHWKHIFELAILDLICLGTNWMTLLILKEYDGMHKYGLELWMGQLNCLDCNYV